MAIKPAPCTPCVQGSECKRLYKELNLQPCDGLVFRKGEMLASGVPSTRLTVMRVADNPHAAAILNSAASAQIRRCALQGLTARPMEAEGLAVFSGPRLVGRVVAR